MKIDKITINNFRNYAGEVTFDLTKNITILYGNNGFGKSSFFDAIEWCFTSEISRFDGNDKDIKRDIINKNNIDIEDRTLSVSIEFGGNTLTRSFNYTESTPGYTSVTLLKKDGEVLRGQESIEEFLKKGKFEGTKFGRSGYSQLIKQTYILSQNQVAAFVITDDPTERFRALANIMGFKALLNESDNMKKIHLSISKQAELIEIEITTCLQSITSKQETKQQVNIFDFNSKLIDIGVIDVEADIDMQLKEVREKMMSDKINSEQNNLSLYMKS